MQPEDIDKLFRDRLDGHATPPPAYLWHDLEAELQPQRRRPVLWLAAAAMALLTLLGGTAWLLLQGPAFGPASQPVASTPRPQPAGPAPQKKSQPQATPAPAAASDALATATTTAVVPPAKTPAPSLTSAARTGGAQPTRPRKLARTTTPAEPRPAPAAPAPEQLALAPAEARPLPEPSAPEPTPGAVAALAQTPAVAPNALATGPIDVEVHPTPNSSAAVAAPAGRPRLGRVLRQARNAVRGDQVSLREAGLALPEKVTVQARLGGRTLTTVIQL
ncbi:hypothetical protein [Hymenobacter weizhouensis]|uniref:hypothetical protein n=1 Tax=Hymenobacter sp. YIM 151500-1 TaxID=2987689 RepID=UPI002226DA44|nr:hypothetical protein [Hymenobacter sp. YIM 151500-1]UYZ64040.1 hypothetical protein OIS53_04135 [Hymenobacter sp. YIM 151500-1]